MPETEQLSWAEFKDEKNFPDETEGEDVDFEFRKTHPDWGMDEKAKEYFRKAQKIVYKKVKIDNDIDPWVARFTSVRRNATKKLESQEEYQETEYDRRTRVEEETKKKTEEAQ